MPTKIDRDVADFGELMSAAMHDAILEDNITQFQVKFIPEGRTKEYVVRIIVCPEQMKHVLGGS